MRHHTALYLSSLNYVLTSASPVYTLQILSTSYDCISCKIETTQQLPNLTPFQFLTFPSSASPLRGCVRAISVYLAWDIVDPNHTPVSRSLKGIGPLNKPQEPRPGSPGVRTRASSRLAFPQVAPLTLTAKPEKNEHSCWPCPGWAQGIKADYIPGIKATHPGV